MKKEGKGKVWRRQVRLCIQGSQGSGLQTECVEIRCPTARWVLCEHLRVCSSRLALKNAIVSLDGMGRKTSIWKHNESLAAGCQTYPPVSSCHNMHNFWRDIGYRTSVFSSKRPLEHARVSWPMVFYEHQREGIYQSCRPKA